MFATFWSDVIVALLGAVFTVLIAVATYAINRRVIEVRALNSLVVFLNQRRALRIPEPVLVPGARDLDDFHRHTASVLAMKDAVQRAREASGSALGVRAPLDAMTRAINLYLEASSAEPDRYWILAEQLRGSLEESVLHLAKARRSVKFLEPGAGAF